MRIQGPIAADLVSVYQVNKSNLSIYMIEQRNVFNRYTLNQKYY